MKNIGKKLFAIFLLSMTFGALMFGSKPVLAATNISFDTGKGYINSRIFTVSDASGVNVRLTATSETWCITNNYSGAGYDTGLIGDYAWLDTTPYDRVIIEVDTNNDGQYGDTFKLNSLSFVSTNITGNDFQFLPNASTIGAQKIYSGAEGTKKIFTPTNNDFNYLTSLVISLGIYTDCILLDDISITALSDVEKVAAAKASITTVITNLTVSNNTTANDILTAAQGASLHGVSVNWDTTNGFNKTNATSSATGSITGTIQLSLGSTSDTVSVNKTIAQLSLSDTEKVALAKASIDAAITNLSVSNNTTASDVISAAKLATLHNVDVVWDETNGFSKTNATSSASGSITGTIKLSLGSTTDFVTVSKTIAQLPLSDAEKVALAKASIEAAITNLSVNNNSTASDVISAAKLATLHNVDVVWDDTNGFSKTNATSSAAGSITGTIKLSIGSAIDIVTVSKTIAQLPLSDAEKIALAKASIEAAITNLSVSNSTTASDVISAAKLATLHNVDVVWDETNGFSKTNATSSAAGSITGTIKLSIGSTTDIVTVSKTIAQLPLSDAEKVALAKASIEAAITNLSVSNSTTASDVISAAKLATLHNVDVVWDDTNGFSKTNATSSAAGSITGTIKLSLGSTTDIVTVSKTIAQLPLSDAEKIALAKASIEAAITNLSVSNNSTANDVISVAKLATLHNVDVAWDTTNGFSKTNATSSAAGSITGTIKLSLNSANDTVVLSKTIAQLPLSDVEKVALAKASIEAVITNLTVSNSTTESDVISAVKQATLHNVDVAWDTTNGFSKTNATSSATGSITGTIKLSLNSANDTVVVSKTIAQLPLSDVEKVALAKASIETAITNLSVSNSTTESDVISAVKQATLHNVDVAWDTTNGFSKTNATSSSAGSITGTIKLSLNSTNDTVVVSKTIAQLPLSDAEKVALAKASIETAISNLSVSNSTTESDVISAVKQATLHNVDVAWDETNGFNKINATSSAVGSITGTIKLSLGSETVTITVNKSIAKLPLSDTEKVALAKASIEAAIANLSVNNSTTESDVISAVKQATLHNVDVAWDTTNGFNKTNATSSAAGSITGTIKLSHGNETVIVTVNKTITKLPLSDTEKVALAKASIEAAITNLSVCNSTTESDVISAVKQATLHNVDVAWDTTNGFSKTNATSSAAGSITGTIKLSLGSETVTVTVNKSIAKLPLSDTEKVALAKASIETAITNLSVNNSTTANDVISAVKQATLHNVDVAWDTTNGFSKTNATSSAAGSITGTIKLSLGSETATVTVSKTIAKLPLSDVEKVALAKASIEAAITNLSVSNSTTAQDILAFVQNAALHGVTVAWDSTNGFNKANATSSATGSVTGKMIISINGVTSTVALNKTIAKLPLSDAEKVAAAKASMVTAISNLSVSNTTSAQDILTIVQSATLHGASVAWDSINGFHKTNATSYSTGSVTGTLVISLGGETSTITVDKAIAKLPSEGGGSSGNNVATPVKPEGKIEKDEKKDESAPAASLNDSSEDLKSKVLSTTDQAQVAMGKDAKVILKIEDINTSVSDEDKKQITEKLAIDQQNASNPTVLYIDISLFKKVGEEEETRVTKTNGKISISIEVPENMWSTEQGIDRTYRVIRLHEGVAELLEGTYDPVTHLFTFETDRFSTYALTYWDVNTTTVKEDGSKTDKITVYQDFNHLRLTAKATKNTQKLTYVKVSGADGYLIYGAQCGKPMKELAVVEGAVTSYTVKNLKQATYYKYQVKAYKIVNGKKVIIATSKLIRSVTTHKTYSNPTKVTIKQASITLVVGKTQKVTYQIVLPKNKKMKDYASLTRFESTNMKIATINSNGKITAKAKGTCYIYVYAQNGVYARVKLIIK